jgi:hypothetical protein
MCNPANFQKLQPIKDLWGNIKQKVYENETQLRLKISSVIKAW